MLAWIDKIPVVPLAVAALLLAIAPLSPEPHLVEKLGMLFKGVLTKPLDIFDLFMHGTPLLLLIVRVARLVIKKS